MVIFYWKMLRETDIKNTFLNQLGRQKFIFDFVSVTEFFIILLIIMFVF